MKSLTKILIIPIVTALVFMTAPLTLAQQNLDQDYSPNPPKAFKAIGADFGQTFTPTLSRLNRIDVRVQLNAGDPISIYIREGTSNANKLLGSGSKNIPANGDQWVSFTFADISLTPETMYSFFISASTANPANGWAYGDSTGDGSYSRGYAVENNTPVSGTDYNFKTFGFTPTVQTINPPIKLTAMDTPNDNGGSIDLTWLASSTSDIDGYAIYRNADKSSNYKQIGKVKATVLNYSDDTVEVDKAYYYVARAYKGSNESANSNRVSVTPVDNKSPDTPRNFRLEENGDDYVILAWDEPPDDDVQSYLIKYGQNSGQLYSEFNTEQKTNMARIDGLQKGLTYYFTLEAIDAREHHSKPTDQLSIKIGATNWLFVSSLVFLGLLIAAGIYLLIARKKKWWPFAKKQRSGKMVSKKGNTMALGKKIGTVTHYFNKIGVGIIKLDGPLKVGGKIKIKGATTDLEQPVDSMQIEHKKVDEAAKGDSIGLKVSDRVREDDKVYLAKE